MSAALKKVEGVASVDVSLEKGTVDIVLKPDNTTTLPWLRRTIRSNGNETKDATVTARGRLVEVPDGLSLDLLNGSSLPIVRPSTSAKNRFTASNKVVEVTGVARADETNAERLTIASVK